MQYKKISGGRMNEVEFLSYLDSAKEFLGWVSGFTADPLTGDHAVRMGVAIGFELVDGEPVKLSTGEFTRVLISHPAWRFIRLEDRAWIRSSVAPIFMDTNLIEEY